MKKRLLSILLVLVLLVGVASVASATGNQTMTYLGFTVWGHDGLFEGAEITVRADNTVVFQFTTDGSERATWWEGLLPLGLREITIAIDFPDGFVIEERRGGIPGASNPEWHAPYEIEFGPDGSFIININNLSPREDIIADFSWVIVPGETQAPVPPQDHPFTDVRANAWYASAVEFVYNEGIMTGTSPTTFAPNANFSREMVLATQFRMANGRPANASDPRNTPFTDVAQGRWYAPYIAWAFNNGLTTGTSPTTFGTGQAVSRQDFALFMYRFANFSGINTSVPGSFTLNFPDASTIGSWAQDALRWAVYEGLITGTGQLLEPVGTASRAQAATILMRYMQEVQ